MLLLLACARSCAGPSGDDADRVETGRESPGDSPGESGDSDDPGPAWREGRQPDDAYGAALVTLGDEVWVGAPFSGTGLAAGAVSSPAGWLEGEPGARLGAAMVAWQGGVLAAAPGTGAVLGAEGRSLGALASTTKSWAGSTAGGAEIHGAAARTVSWGEPAFSLAFLPTGELAGGFPLSAQGLRTEAARVATPTGSEAGYALLVGDYEADGDLDLLVGAPGEDAVYVLDPAALPTALTHPAIRGPGGRFGSALALLGDGALIVGAPAWAVAEKGVPEPAGATFVVRGGEPTAVRVGAPGEALGTALAVGADVLYTGAPGPWLGPGRVYQDPLP